MQSIYSVYAVLNLAQPRWTGHVIWVRMPMYERLPKKDLYRLSKWHDLVNKEESTSTIQMRPNIFECGFDKTGLRVNSNKQTNKIPIITTMFVNTVQTRGHTCTSRAMTFIKSINPFLQHGKYRTKFKSYYFFSSISAIRSKSDPFLCDNY